MDTPDGHKDYRYEFKRRIHSNHEMIVLFTELQNVIIFPQQ